MVKGTVKVLMALLLCIALCVGALPAAASETPSNWAAEGIARAEQLELVYYELRFDYQKAITRRQFASLALQLYERITVKIVDEKYAASPYTDVDFVETGIIGAHALGIVTGVSATEFAPERPVTRQEICVMLGRLLDRLDIVCTETEPEKRAALASSTAIPDWARERVLTMVGLGVLTGTGDNYDLESATSCEQAVLLVLRLFELVRTAQNTVFTPKELAAITEQKEMKSAMSTNRFIGNIYLRAPVIQGTQDPGVLQPSFLQDGLNTINYARLIAGLPHNITLSDEENRAAQAGAMLLMLGSFDHVQPKPDKMDEALYRKGLSATSSGNIGRGHPSLAAFNLSCMDDSDPSNIDSVGHRRWLLSAWLGKVGMGCVEGNYVTTVFDSSGTLNTAPDLVCWPAEGVFPLEETNKFLAWSCTPESNRYALEESDGVVITMRRQDGAVFILTEAMDDPKQPGYFIISGSGYGHGSAFIFRPHLDGYSYGDIYEVEISNVELCEGGTTTIRYTTKFYA